MPDPLVFVDSLAKQYESRLVLDGVSFALNRGERVALMGPSGSGKTTLLNCLGGIDRADSGSVKIDGVELRTLESEALALLRRRVFGTVFQFFHLLPTLSALENVELPLQLLGVGSKDRVARARAMLDRVGVSHRSSALPSKLSGGEQQRVAIARALVHAPALILADEPTGSLDSANGASILQLLSEVTREQGASLILVTHSEEAAVICERRIHLRDGRVVSEASA